MELLVVQYCQEDADFNKKKITKVRQKNAKIMRFQNFPNFAENFTQFLGYAVCWGENYGGEKSLKKKNFGKIFFVEFFLFFENIFGDHFHISQFVPL